MSEGRGLTLRKKKSQKRPVISAPQAQKPASKPTTETNALSIPQERNAPTETSDLVKRRYSTRYNQLPNFSDAPDVPLLPGAAQLKRRSGAASPRRPGTAQSAHPLKVDQDALSNPDLQHERYVTDLLSNASETDIQEYQQSLKRIKHRTSMDLQQSVYQNRTQFIKISKEAEKLKAEMSNLRTMMGELTTALGQSSTSNEGPISGPENPLGRRSTHRSSVANLEHMWSTQLHALWKYVEKSQKFLPAVPGRHIVMETGNWIELDSATWKPKRPVHIVLLNDHLLVASKKRKRIDPNVPQTGPAPTKLVAEDCWPLQDIDVEDMAANVSGGQMSAAEEKAVSTAVSVRAGGRTLTYRHDKRDEPAKQEFLSSVRKTLEEWRRANVPKTEKANTTTDTLNYYAARDPASAKNTAMFNTINSGKDKPDILIEVDGKQQNFRWLEGQIDDLDIAIALQKFDEAVAKVEKLREIVMNLKNNTIAQSLISLKIDERAAKLATVLCRELADTPSFLETTKRTTNYLSRLGFEDRARQVYLTARAEALVKRTRQCIFDGDLHKYVFSISYVYFTMIKNTVLIFQASFAPSMMSACIKWANEHLETFNALLVRQLSSVEKNGKAWRDCMDVVWSHERELLGEVGLDFREVIGRGLEQEWRDSTAAGQRLASPSKRDRSRSKSRPRTAAGQ